MSEPSDIVCFTCGKPAGEEPRLNTLASGELCPTCRNRVLEALPPLLPNFTTGEEHAPLGETAFLAFPELPFEPDDGPIGA